MIRHRALLAATLAVAAAVGYVFATDPPDSEVNPQTGYIESVVSTWNEFEWDIRHVVDPGQGKPEFSTVLTSNGQDDLGPRIAIDPGGDTWVVWWRDGATPEVLYRKHDYSAETWSAESRISADGESSSHPVMVLDSSSVWVVFVVDQGSTTSVSVNGGGRDEVEPFPGRTILATTTHANVDAMVHVDSGHLWVTWVDSVDDVGWREYDYATEGWETADFESYVNDTVEGARGRIRDAILGS